MIKKILISTLTAAVLVGFAPFKAQADPGATELIQRVQRNFSRIHSLEGNYSRTFTAKGHKTDLLTVKYSYQNGKKAYQETQSGEFFKADGAYEYHGKGKQTHKRAVVQDDLIYLPYLPFVTLSPTILKGYDLTVTGSEYDSGVKTWLLEGRVKNQKNKNIHIVWKIGDGTGVVNEVDIYDGGNNLAQVFTVNYNNTNGVYVPSRILEDVHGKLLHSQYVYDYGSPNLEAAPPSHDDERDNTPTPTPTATQGSGLVQNLVVGPNVSDGKQPVHINVTLGHSATVHLGIFTLLGEQVYSTTASGTQGVNSLTWDVKNQAKETVATGLYIYVLQVDDGTNHQVLRGKILIHH